MAASNIFGVDNRPHSIQNSASQRRKNMKNIVTVTFLFLALLFLGLSTSPQPASASQPTVKKESLSKCSDDDQCPSGQRCINGVCITTK
jgi:Cys-rich repeat protein